MDTLAPRPFTASPSRQLMNTKSPYQRPSTSPALEQTALLPPTINVSQSLKTHCKSSPNAKTSLFASSGLGSYRNVVDQVWADDSALTASSGESGAARADRKAKGYVLIVHVC